MKKAEREVSARELVDGYEVLFDETLRAAHRACLDYARTFRADKWPIPLDVLTFARLYRVSAAELGALFGLLLQTRKGEQVWLDLMRGPVQPLATGLDFSRVQCVALGWHKAAVEVIGGEARH